MVGVASIGTCRVTIGTCWIAMPWVTVAVVTGVVSWAEAGATWHLAAGGTTGLAVGVCLCLSLAGM